MGGVLYLLIGIVTASIAGSAHSIPSRNAWRLAAWVLSLVVFVFHLLRERVFLGRTAPQAALHAAAAVALGALALAAAGPVRSHWGTETAGRAELALVTWPLLLGVPAFLAGLAGAAALRSSSMRLPARTSVQTRWEPFAEPWRTTALRTGGLALGIGLGVGLYKRHLAAVPLVALLALWFTLGGHFLELLFRNRLRARLPVSPAAQALARLAYWFAAGSVLYFGAALTGVLFDARGVLPRPWWLGGIGFVGAELFIHLLIRMRGQPGFYDGRG